MIIITTYIILYYVQNYAFLKHLEVSGERIQPNLPHAINECKVGKQFISLFEKTGHIFAW